MESEAAVLLVRHDVARDDGKERIVARNCAPQRGQRNALAFDGYADGVDCRNGQRPQMLR